MHQLISRPTVYLVIGIGVLALLVSQLRSADDQARTAVSELDPFSSLENLAGRNLAISSPDRVSVAVPEAVNAIAIVGDEIANSDITPNEMVRDEMTSVSSYQQTNAGKLNNDHTEIQSVETSIEEVNVAAPLSLADMENVQSVVPAVNEIKQIDDSLTVLDLEKPILLDGEESKARYHLEEAKEDLVETEPTAANPVAFSEEVEPVSEPASVFEKTQQAAQEDIPSRSREWRRNPFMDRSDGIVETKSANETLELETSSNGTSHNLEGVDSIKSDTATSTEAKQVSAVGNFEPGNAPSVVSAIPISDQQMQSVMSTEDQFGRTESLPIVVGLPDSVAQKAVHNIEYGKSLSRRGAAFAARQEFYSSLRILSQAHDTQAGGTAYTRALRDAIVALKEAEDFIVSDTETQIGLNVAAVVDGHTTRLISGTEAANMTAIGAMQRYFAFANTQLQIASGQNAVAAEAFYCLGKLHTTQAKFGANASKLDIAKAIVFHQAAIASDKTNFRSANELGVLLANSGRLQESQAMLKKSLQIQQLPQAWKNLAVVHQRSGEGHLAELAHKEFLISSRQEIDNMRQNTIRWISPGQFNQGTPLELRQAAQTPQAIQQAPQRDMSKPSIGQRLRSLF